LATATGLVVIVAVVGEGVLDEENVDELLIGAGVEDVFDFARLGAGVVDDLEKDEILDRDVVGVEKELLELEKKLLLELENEELPPRAIKPLFKIKRLQHTKVRNFFIEYSF
jgi:hypothetical protein